MLITNLLIFINFIQGLSIAMDDRLPWNLWSPKEFQFQENKTNGIWQPWNFSYFENRNYRNRQNSRLFVQPECFSSGIGSLDKMQVKPGVLGTDQSMIFQNIFNENGANHFQKPNLSKDGFSRKKKRRNCKLYRPTWLSKLIANDRASDSPFEFRQQSCQSWNHVPVFEWSNLSPRPFETCFRNIANRSGSFKENNKDLSQSHNSARKKFTKNKFSKTISEATASSSCFKSDNHSTRSMNNAATVTSYAKCLSGANMDEKGNQVNSATSNNSKNFKEDDDVMYLFSVDSSSEGKMFLEIDLQSDGVNLISNNNSPKAQTTKVSR